MEIAVLPYEDQRRRYPIREMRQGDHFTVPKGFVFEKSFRVHACCMGKKLGIKLSVRKLQSGELICWRER